MESVNILKNFFLLLFPTHFKTEGIPGTIIDAYFAGLPVLSSRWNSFDDVIIDRLTGFGFEMNNNDEFENILLYCLENPKIVHDMRNNCIEQSKFYSPDYNFSIINAMLC